MHFHSLLAPSETSAEKRFCLVSLLILAVTGLFLIFLTPPFQVPDEPNHFRRAYQISEGRLIAEVHSTESGGMLPASLTETVNTAQVPYWHAKYDVHRVMRALKIPLNPTQRNFQRFENSAMYCPVLFLPQAIGIYLGRVAGLPPILLLYLARLFNFAATCGLIAGALNRPSLLRRPLLVLAMMPVSVFLLASASPDAGLLGWAFSLSVVTWRVIQGTDRTRADFLWLILASLVVGLSKSVYCILAVPVLLAFVRERNWKTGVVGVVAICMAFGSALIWTNVAEFVYRPLVSGLYTISAAKQFIAEHKLQFVGMVLQNFGTHTLFYVKSMVAVLGILDVEGHWRFIVPYCAFLGAVAFVDFRNQPVSLFEKAVLLACAVTGAILIVVSQFLVWTKLGAMTIYEAQGRYFIPLIPMLLPLLAFRGPARFTISDKAVWVAVGLSGLYTVALVIRYYYV